MLTQLNQILGKIPQTPSIYYNLTTVYMRVEIDYFSTSEKKGERCIRSHSIPAGDWKPVKFLGKETKIAVFCNLKSDKAAALIIDPNRKLGATLYKSIEDDEGEDVDMGSNPDSSPDSAIATYVEITGEQMLSIYTDNKKSTSEVLIYLDFNESERQESDPQNVLDPILTS